MDPSFGGRLRAQRERQQVALADIAEETKIKRSLLEGLERDDISQWPSGIFRRSYVRTYACAIGLDPETVVREFLERYPDPVEESAAAVATASEVQSVGRRPPTRLRFLIGSALGALPGLRLQSSPHDAAAPVAGTPSGIHPDDHGPFFVAPVETAIAAAHDCSSGPDAFPALSPAVAEDELPVPAAAATVAVAEVRPASSTRSELSDLAALCTRLARTADPADVAPLFQDAAALLGVVGLTLWMWDPRGGTLRPVLGHGYADALLSQLGGVAREADNALAAAFRSGDTQIVNGGVGETGALVVPLLTPSGCAGVLALELHAGVEHSETVRAFATIFVAQLAVLIGYPPALDAATA